METAGWRVDILEFVVCGLVGRGRVRWSLLDLGASALHCYALGRCLWLVGWLSWVHVGEIWIDSVI